MRNRVRIFSAALWVSIVVAAPRAGLGDELRTPSSVMAQIDGSFSFLAKFYKGTGSDQLASFGWTGEVNVGGGLVADCFCLPGTCTLEPGDSLAIEVSGKLTDPGQDGRVRLSVNLCTTAGQAATTAVRSYWTTGVEGGSSRALRFWNAPNPVAPSTTFHWELREPGPVQLRIFDLKGRVLATLVDEVQPTGRHQVGWNAESLPATRSAGICFARLSTAGGSSTRSLVVRR